MFDIDPAQQHPSQIYEDIGNACHSMMKSDLLNATDLLKKATLASIQHNQVIDDLPKQLASLLKTDKKEDPIRLIDFRKAMEQTLDEREDKNLPNAMQAKPENPSVEVRKALAFKQLIEEIRAMKTVLQYAMP